MAVFRDHARGNANLGDVRRSLTGVFALLDV
jgi:hypothetical protein